MNAWIDLAQNGLGVETAAVALLHSSMGVFFAASGWNKLTNKARHETMKETLIEDHVPFVHFNEWWVPSWELAGGVALAIGFLPAFFAGVLLVICGVATLCEAPKRVRGYAPINGVDTIADYLYLPEVLYSIILLAIVMGV